MNLADIKPERNVALSSSDREAILYQPYITVRSRIDVPLPHKDAFQLLNDQINRHSARTKLDRERVGRIWAEFIVPWFGCPANTVRAELRDSTSVVKFALGQEVKTAYGDGQIVSVIDGNSSTAFRYRVKLPFGVGFLRPTAIIHKIPERPGNPFFVRRGGHMEKMADDTGSIEEPLGKRFQLFFATQSIYYFIRLYCFLVNVLVDTREHLRLRPTGEDQFLEIFCFTRAQFKFEKIKVIVDV